MRYFLTQRLADILRERLYIRDGYRFDATVLESGESTFSVSLEAGYPFDPELASVRVRLDLDSDRDTVIRQILADLLHNPAPDWSVVDFRG